MTLTEVLGWSAAGLVFATFWVKTMIPLRLVAMASNAVFVVYGLMLGAPSIIALHGTLLPLNLWRLHKMRDLTQRVRSASRGPMDLSMLLPYMSQHTKAAGEVFFHKGDLSDHVIYVISGTVRIADLDRHIGPGELLGEMGVFSEDRRRTDTAVAETEVTYGQISAERFWEVFFQDPAFGAYLIRTIVRRANTNVEWATSRYQSALTEQG